MENKQFKEWYLAPDKYCVSCNVPNHLHATSCGWTNASIILFSPTDNLNIDGTESRKRWEQSLDWFYAQPFSMQWGVYLEFFDSVGIIVDTQPFLEYDSEKYIAVYQWDFNIAHLNHTQEIDLEEGGNPQDSRQKAQIHAIKKAFEILEKELVK